MFTLNANLLFICFHSHQFKQLMLKIDKEGSDDESDSGLNKSATTTPKKSNPNEYVAAAAVTPTAHQPNHINNMNSALIGNAGQTPLQSLPKVLPVNSAPYT